MAKINIGATLSLKEGNFFTNMKSATSASKNLQRALGDATKKMGLQGSATSGLGNALKKTAGIVTGVVASFAALSTVKDFIAESVELANAQTAAEKRLETTMMNVKGTTMAQVDAMKKYASELQGVTTIGDEVSIVGASQLATFQLQSDTIKQLLPSLQDLAVAQYGTAVSADQMQSMSNLVGKVMTGNVGSLTKYGVTMDATQQKILKTGTEAERAAMLVEVLGQNFGGLAQAMAETPEGRIQQLKNAWGDMQEIIGMQLYPAITSLLTYITSKLPAIQSVFQSVVTACQPALGWITSTGIPMLGSAIEGIVSMGSQIYTACQPALQSLRDAITNLGSTISATMSGDFGASITNLASTVLPMLINAVTAVTNIFSVFAEHANWLVPIITGIAVGIKGMMIFNTVVSAITPVITVIQSLGGVLAALKVGLLAISGPVGWIIAGVGALIGIGVALYKNWDKIKEYAAKVWESCKAGWNNLKTGITDKLNGIKDGIKNGWENVKTNTANAWNNIVSKCSQAWNNLKSKCAETWSNIKSKTSSALSAVKSEVEKNGGGVKGVTVTYLKAVAQSYKIYYDKINQLTGGRLGNVVATCKGKFDEIKTSLLNKFNNMKTTAINGWNSLKTIYNQNGGNITATISTVWTNIKSYFSSGFSAINSLTGGRLGTLVNTFKSKFDSIKTTVLGCIEKIKSAFNFKWELPKIKLPHFKIDGTFDLPKILEGKLPFPEVGIDWYAKGGIMTKPTAFGFNGTNAMVGGEAGPEAIVPLSRLWDSIDKFADKIVGGTTNNNNNDININIYADGKSVDEIVSELVPKLKFALNNI